MRRFLVLTLSCFFLAAPAHAQSMKGRITSVDSSGQSFQLITTNRETQSMDVVIVNYNDLTEFHSDLSADDLKVGGTVIVEGDREGNRLLAYSVQNGASIAG